MDQTDKKQKSANVFVDEEKHSVPAGDTSVETLISELGLPADTILYLVHGNERRLLGGHEIIDVENGLHLEAISGGGVS